MIALALGVTLLATSAMQQRYGAWQVTRVPGPQRVITMTARGPMPAAAAAAGDAIAEARALIATAYEDEALPPACIGAPRERTLPGGTRQVEMRQCIGAEEIENAILRVTFSRDGQPVDLICSYVTQPESAPVASLTAAEGALLVHRRLTPEEKKLKVGVTTSAPFLFAWQNAVYRAYRVTLRLDRIVAGKPVPYDVREYVIDARSGNPLQTFYRMHAASARAAVFDPNPRTTAGPAVTFNNVPRAAYRNVVLEGLQQVNGRLTLSGPAVRIVNREGPDLRLPRVTDRGEFRLVHGTPEFAGLMAYYHVDAMVRRLKALGFEGVPRQPLDVDVLVSNGPSDACQYVPANPPYLRFGRKTVFFAEDAEVIAHEFGHAILATVEGNWFDQDREGLIAGEGFGDYWAMATFFEQTRASGGDQACFAEWMFWPRKCVRRLDLRRSYPPPAEMTVHDAGQLWSAILFDIHRALPVDLAERVILQGHLVRRDTAPEATLALIADGIIVADQQETSGRNRDTLCAVFTGRCLPVASCAAGED
ncbi:MAG TPA: M36 family metallopeptidase [Thermoanaerobaculia bacterium]